MNTMTAINPIITNRTSSANPINTMNTTTKPANPVKALRFLLSAIGLTIALSAAAQPTTPSYIKFVDSWPDVIWERSYMTSGVRVDHYEIFMDGYKIGTVMDYIGQYPNAPVNVAIGGFDLVPATPDNFHMVKVRAVDAAGKMSGFSPEIELEERIDTQINIKVPETVAAHTPYTLECLNPDFDLMDVWKVKCDQDGNPLPGKSPIWVGSVNGKVDVWNGHEHPLAKGPATYGWNYDDISGYGAYWTNGSRLRIDFTVDDLVNDDSGYYLYYTKSYNEGDSVDSGDYAQAIVHVTS